MFRKLQEDLSLIQLQGGNNSFLEIVMSSLLKLFKKRHPRIWVRNSYYFKAHHPGISDIDLTYRGDLFTAKKIFKDMKKFKVFGELNYYPEEIIEDLLKLINPFELSRDPLLKSSTSIVNGSNTQKYVFLLRHITGDSYWLKRYPAIRQKKWNYLLNIINEDLSLFSLTLKNLSALTPYQHALDFYFDGESEDLFNHLKKSPYRALFPHRHIWEESDNSFIQGLDTQAQELLIEQIKWEFWGIGTQLHWIDLKISIEFLERLFKLLEHFSPHPEDIRAMSNILNYMLKEEAS